MCERIVVKFFSPLLLQLATIATTSLCVCCCYFFLPFHLFLFLLHVHFMLVYFQLVPVVNFYLSPYAQQYAKEKKTKPSKTKYTFIYISGAV